MYIQITTKCNMRCAHCCFAATRHGEHMPLNVFQKALSVAIDHGDIVTIGGGEPTMHPRFFEYLNLVREEQRRGNFEIEPFLATNGKAYGKADRLLRILEREQEWGEHTISVNLSRDRWHDGIDGRIVQRYHQLKVMTKNLIDFRSVTKIAPVGRGRNGVFDEQRTITPCACEDALVDPQGQVWSCGCKKRLLGSIWDSGALDDYDSEYAHEGGKAPPEEDEAHPLG